MENLLNYIFESMGLNFALDYYKKVQFNPTEKIQANILNKIEKLLISLEKGIGQIIQQQIPLFCKYFAALMQIPYAPLV